MKTLLLKTTFIASLLIAMFSILNTSNAKAQTPSWWQENAQTQADFTNINFADNNTGWVMGDSVNGALFIMPILKKTTNQGANWSTQSFGSNLYKVKSSHFFNTSSGLVVGEYLVSGGGAILSTTNGGTSWIANDTFPNILKDVFFINATTGWICGQNGYMIKTTNGGATWTAQISNSPDHLFSVHFTDVNNGWAVGPNGVIVHTSNGGTTWTLQTSPVPTQDNFGVLALSSTTAFAVGSNGLMIKTSNSGTTWTTVTVPTVGHIFDIIFVTASSGWAGGAGGNIEITIDGGLTWTSQISNTANDIKSIVMKNTGLGWYAGLTGTVYYYGTSPASVSDLNNNYSVNIFPNPMNDASLIQIEGNNINDWDLIITDITGKIVREANKIQSSSFLIKRENLSSGTYLYSAYTKEGIIAHGKLIVQ